MVGPLLERTGEGEHGLGVLPWSPLKSGLLSGKYSRHRRGPVDSLRGGIVDGPSEKDYDVIDVLEDVARQAGVTPAAAALAWVRQRPGVTSTLVGARRVAQFRANLASLDVPLTDAQMAALNKASSARY